jgi:hypothetical protein
VLFIYIETWQVHKNPEKNTCGNFSDTLFNFEKFARNVAGYGNFEKNYKSLGTWQVSEIYEVRLLTYAEIHLLRTLYKNVQQIKFPN